MLGCLRTKVVALSSTRVDLFVAIKSKDQRHGLGRGRKNDVRANTVVFEARPVELRLSSSAQALSLLDVGSSSTIDEVRVDAEGEVYRVDSEGEDGGDGDGDELHG